jgi:hypothetical protein
VLQVVTINGARISRDKHDIPIPQGIAHAVDRVMFPLPVGNIIQTLRSDRERRFTKFLRALQASGLADTFTGNNTPLVLLRFDVLTALKMPMLVFRVERPCEFGSR